MKSKKTGLKNKPKIFLIGCGAWGKNHLDGLRDLAKKKIISFGGVIEKDLKSRQEITKKYKVSVFADLTRDILEQADAFDIVTPAKTHFEIAKKCLLCAPVFIEKPLTLSRKTSTALQKLSKKSGHKIFCGHIYRFSPSARKLKGIIEKSKTKPVYAEANFLSRPEKLPNDCGILFSEPHPLDIFDFLFEKEPECLSAKISKSPGAEFEDNAALILRYGKNLGAAINLSWTALPKTRSLTLFFPDKKIYADFVLEKIFITSKKGTKEIRCAGSARPLELELKKFADLLSGRLRDYPDGKVGARIVKIIENILWTK